MAQDAFGNYVVGVVPIAVNPLPTSGGGASGLKGVGSPEGVETGSVGQTYKDTATGDVYIFFGTAGETTGWELLGSDGIIYGSGADPNGVVTATRPAIYYGSDGSVWLRMTAGTNSVWEQKLE